MEGFQWPDPTDKQLREVFMGQAGTLANMRAAIHLARRLDAGINPNALRIAWMNNEENAYDCSTWILTRGGTVDPLPSPVPTLAEALEAAQFLAGDSAGVVIRYLQAQQQEDGDDG